MRPTLHGVRAFTLLEVALMVAIIGMMLMMIVGYLFAPKPQGPLPPLPATPVPWATTPMPGPKTAATPAPATPAAAAKPAASPAPTQTIELSPQSAPLFR